MKFFIDMQNQYEYQFKLNPPVQRLDIFMVVLKFYQYLSLHVKSPRFLIKVFVQRRPRLFLPADPLRIDACPSPSVEAAFSADEILSPFIDTT